MSDVAVLIAIVVFFIVVWYPLALQLGRHWPASWPGGPRRPVDPRTAYAPPTPGQLVVTRAYEGDQTSAGRIYGEDAASLARVGYHPTSVDWSPGRHPTYVFLVALALIIMLAFVHPVLILLGGALFVLLIVRRPPGSLAVTYQLARPVGDAARPLAPSTATPTLPPILADRLRQLAAARDAGLISPAEHDAKRGDLLAQL